MIIKYYILLPPPLLQRTILRLHRSITFDLKFVEEGKHWYFAVIIFSLLFFFNSLLKVIPQDFAYGLAHGREIEENIIRHAITYFKVLLFFFPPTAVSSKRSSSLQRCRTNGVETSLTVETFSSFAFE